MPYEFDAARPIYLQLAEVLARKIVSGEKQPGERLPGVRELAAEYGVNPNTAQRTMAELERLGLVRAERTTGRFVTDDCERIAAARRGIAGEEIAGFLKRMHQMGIGKAELMELLTQFPVE